MASNNTATATWLMAAKPIGIAYLQSPDNTGIVARVVRRPSADRIETQSVYVAKGAVNAESPSAYNVSAGGESIRVGLDSFLALTAGPRKEWGNWTTATVSNEGELSDLIAAWQKLTATGQTLTGGVGKASSSSNTGLLIGGAALLAFLLLRGRK